MRLCDGFFFPNVLEGEGDEGCAAQCPDAPTAYYSKPANSDDIEDAVSLTGAPYSALPVAKRHTTEFDSTCSCHRSFTHSYVAEILHDRTLRNGDLVMTPKGFAVFKGGKSSVGAPGNFVALDKSSSIPKDSRLELTAMEHAGFWNRQSGPYSYSAPSSDAVETAKIAPRPRKGIITVEDSDATADRNTVQRLG